LERSIDRAAGASLYDDHILRHSQLLMKTKSDAVRYDNACRLNYISVRPKADGYGTRD